MVELEEDVMNADDQNQTTNKRWRAECPTCRQAFAFESDKNWWPNGIFCPDCRDEGRQCMGILNFKCQERPMSETTAEPHPDYGPCDGYGPDGGCSECTGLIQRVDGSIVPVRRERTSRIAWKDGRYQNAG